MSTFYVKGKYTYIEHPNIQYITEEDGGYFNDWFRWRYGYTHDTGDLMLFIRALNAMIADRVPSAYIVDEDALLPHEWDIQTGDDDVFISLGPGVIWCTREFALGVMNNLNMSQNADVIIEGFLKSLGITPKKYDISQKISTLSSWDEPKRSESALAFIHGYGGLPKVKFTDIMDAYELYWANKKELEAKFQKIYGLKIDIKRAFAPS
jgi:hypothetical protein